MVCNRIIQHVIFSLRLLHCVKWFWDFFILSCISNPFFLLLSNFPFSIVHIYQILFMYSYINGQLTFYQLLDIVNTADMCLLVCFPYLCWFLKLETLRSHNNYVWFEETTREISENKEQTKKLFTEQNLLNLRKTENLMHLSQDPLLPCPLSSQQSWKCTQASTRRDIEIPLPLGPSQRLPCVLDCCCCKHYLSSPAPHWTRSMQCKGS